MMLSMSPGFANKLFRHFPTLFLLVIAQFFIPATVRANSFDITITALPSDPARVHVEGVTGTETKAWSFPGERLTTGGQGERVSNFALADASGVEVRVRRLAPGEFESDDPASRFSYDLMLAPPLNAADAAHLSWVSGERGVLFLSDVLPILPSKGKVALQLSVNWEVFSVEAKDRQGRFEIPDAGRSLFVIGRDLRARNGRVDTMEVTHVIAGEWAFPDEEIVKTSKENLDDFRKLMGGLPRRHSMVVLLPFPSQVAGQLWSAETRGGTVLLLSGRLPSKLAALAQLNAALTHELFHLWVPNGLALKGDYGWFYEGFTLYQVLRMGMRQGRLTFQDYLNALGRAFDAYKSVRGRQELSLIEASERRWTSNPAFVYHKGMLVAFLYELTLMRRTEGKSSLVEVYRELYQRHGGADQKVDASGALISVLNGMPGMNDFSDQYIQNANQLDLVKEIEIFGLRIATGGVRTHVFVADSISRQQRDLLRRLGYNERRAADERRLQLDLGNHLSLRR